MNGDPRMGCGSAQHAYDYDFHHPPLEVTSRLVEHFHFHPRRKPIMYIYIYVFLIFFFFFSFSFHSLLALLFYTRCCVFCQVVPYMDIV